MAAVVAAPSPRADAALELDRIEAAYGHAAPVLRGLSLRVPKGRIVALLGANGAGKTTAIRAIAGLLPYENGAVTAGSIRLDGRRVDGVPPHRRARRRLAAVLEGRRLFAELTVVIPAAVWKPCTSSFRCWRRAAATAPVTCPGASSRCWPLAGPC